MRRTVIVLPGLIGPDPENSPLLQKLETLRTMTELGELKRLSPLPPMDTPEAIWLGLPPTEGQLRQGPLTVSALGADPPERSTHFHVSLLGYRDGQVVATPAIVPEEDLRVIVEQAKKLNTRLLTFLAGENLDHGLVWENVGDMLTPAPPIGQSLKSNLPEGDAERDLRRFIDDSINLLTSLELNERRLDQDLPPLNLLWPWGHAMRKPVPNLVLRRGEPARVESGSMRLAGLTRLAGYKHGDRHAFGSGVNTRLEHLAETALSRDLSIVVFDAPAGLRSSNLQEELHWFVSELDRRLLKPLFDSALKSRARLTLVAPGATTGLALDFEMGNNRANHYPFDERSLEEKSLPQVDAWTVIEKALKPVVDSIAPR
ncbi:MAG: 2,3-bisphosphoglycerate-independent phosphoglycerate mutase [Fimbriimonadaceae bacterium]|jgi:hypothetical protein|nr:2,3-bisphosphoglycerate-independent phosphoglycerate mutase [Fimbriimonadaceae bacterium]